MSRLPQLVIETKQDLADAGLQSTIVGHVGDGNFHALILFRNDEELESVTGAVHRLVHRAIALEGTCQFAFHLLLIPLTSLLGTGEHGVGVGKKDYLVDELGQGTVELMRAIKLTIDPFDLMNPGKVGWLTSLNSPKADSGTSCIPISDVLQRRNPLREHILVIEPSRSVTQKRHHHALMPSCIYYVEHTNQRFWVYDTNKYTYLRSIPWFIMTFESTGCSPSPRGPLSLQRQQPLLPQRVSLRAHWSSLT